MYRYPLLDFINFITPYVIFITYGVIKFENIENNENNENIDPNFLDKLILGYLIFNFIHFCYFYLTDPVYNNINLFDALKYHYVNYHDQEEERVKAA